MLKKAGLLTVGITAGLLAVAPIASAGEYEGDNNDKKSSQDDDNNKKNHENDDEGDDWGDDSNGDQDGTGNIQCDASGGGFESNQGGAGSEGTASPIANTPVGPIASGNTGQLLSCNAFLNNILNDNEVNVLSAP